MAGRIEALRRRWFGKYTIDDPRPIAADAPYTFYLPSENELLAIAPGDLVKLIIRSVPPSAEWDAERMWVTVAAVGNPMQGQLENVPYDMPQLGVGSRIAFRRGDVIDIDWSETRTVSPPAGPERRWYWERCFVDDCILRGKASVDYLYREEPDMTGEDGAHPDSGWRLRATQEAIHRDESAGQAPQYVALGAVLNRDDSWLHLIDEPIGTAYQRDLESGLFRPCADDL